jgi:hypothetical protein
MSVTFDPSELTGGEWYVVNHGNDSFDVCSPTHGQICNVVSFRRDTDAAFIALARNAEDVRQRRKLWTEYDPESDRWVVTDLAGWIRKNGVYGTWFVSKDSLSALVAADAWLKEQEELDEKLQSIAALEAENIELRKVLQEFLIDPPLNRWRQIRMKAEALLKRETR